MDTSLLVQGWADNPRPPHDPGLRLGQVCDDADIFNRVCPIWVIILNKRIVEFAEI